MTEFPQTRSSLIAQVRSPEDRESWDQFVIIYRPVIYRMARRRGLQDADAQDLVQTVLMRVARAIPSWERSGPETKFRHWLRRVTRNAIATAFSRKPRDAAAGGTEMLDLLAEQPADAADIERELARESMRERYLRTASVVKAEVDSDTWRAFELTVVNRLPCEEVASQLGKSVGAVYAARGRVMRRLRDQAQRMKESGI
ncbi:MAG: sigma-70 family RNA polymerase sigma factor [Planctomycetales bacterium]|nr:sigma-70 family RNA polymerase sigma factor [Planctomycetales bacterium]